jgi:hypothetical protein
MFHDSALDVDQWMLMRLESMSLFLESFHRFHPTPMRFLAQILLALLLTPVSVALAAPPGAEALHDSIDQHIKTAFAKWKVSAAETCTDAEFIRRVSLDLTGVVPDAKTTRAFLSDPSADKRVKLTDRLLNSAAYAEHMAISFDVFLMQRRPDKYVTTDEWRAYLQTSFAANKPLDKLVGEILVADGVDPTLRPAAKFFLDRAVDKDTLVRDIGRLLLGVDLQCAQCHDHPDIDQYLHRHYHGLSVFVAGSKTFRQPDGKTVLQEMVTREVEFASVFEPDKTKTTGPRLLEVLMTVPAVEPGEEYVEKPSRTVRAVPKFSLRELLATKLVSNQTPEFAHNMANRLWAKMLGRGLVHPLEMHHVGNPPSHPELLERLAKQLVETKYDVRAFLREIVLSKAYQRSSQTPAGVDPNTIPAESFAVANMKGLSPEQLFHSLLQVTGSEKMFIQQIEATLQEDEATYKELSADKEKLAKGRSDQRALRIKEFITLFGSPLGKAEGEFQASLPQVLFLANNPAVFGWVQPGSGNLTEQLAVLKDDSQVAENAFLAVLSRFPNDDEVKLFREHLALGKDNRQAAVTELVWSLIASAEFRLNH